ncbi:MAG: oligosaccharide flippase family protein, partial [Bdellovibrionales bacterium]|nr:oligosaccharide flippase family protein [Bdellovibrionales bacterium]
MTSLRGKFSTDLIWNFGSLAVLGGAGIVINIIIASYAGSDALGVFNQVFAIYIFLSQICVGGVHFSLLKEVSYAQDDIEHCARICTSALALSAIISFVICIVSFSLTGVVENLLDSVDVGKGLVCAIPGLIFFSLNKNLLNLLNGLQWMRAFAVFQALRFLGILIEVFVIVLVSQKSWMLALS